MRTILFILAASASISACFGQAAGYTRINTLSYSVAGASANSMPATIYARGNRNYVNQIPFDVDHSATRITRLATICVLHSPSSYGSPILGAIVNGQAISWDGNAEVFGAPSGWGTDVKDPDGSPHWGYFANGNHWLITQQPSDAVTATMSLTTLTGSPVVYMNQAVTSAVSNGKVVNGSARVWVNGGQNNAMLYLTISGPGRTRMVVRVTSHYVRAIGGVNPVVQNPNMHIYGPGVDVWNDNWVSSPDYAQIVATGFTPIDSRECAAIVEFSAGEVGIEAMAPLGDNGVVLIDFSLF